MTPKPSPFSSAERELPSAEDFSCDHTRPAFHFLPPANWMNDPNGPIYHNGYYHVFYQHNPFADWWGDIHWGHARSRDLVQWEHQPIALHPSRDRDEAHCYSGTCTIRPDGTPAILYTKVGPGGSEQPFEQWLALGDSELRHWTKYQGNPVLSLDNHDGPSVLGDWRDPYLFEYQGAIFMVLGAVLCDRSEELAAVLLYRAHNNELTEWRFQSVLFSSPRYERRFLECPNFIRLGNRWVLLVSPYHPVEYYVGELEHQRLQFHPKRKDRLDHSIDFYASNAFTTPDGRVIVVGWISGFKKGLGWNGCLSLPREIELSEDNTLLQRPARELTQLRDREYGISCRRLRNRLERVPGLESTTLEIRARLRPSGAGRFGLRLRMGPSDNSGLEIALESDAVIVGGMKVRFAPEIEELVANRSAAEVDICLYLDNSVLELFLFDGRIAVTKIVEEPDDHLQVGVFADGELQLEEFRAWSLRPAPVQGFPG